ncbi:MAG: peptide chain release factor N(5)-glutamine methyltransferase [Saprospiraceae bacterium]|nr:peptide chain release factor N(5)-glutamine methyltransferase [Saprospiraceae bacterium]
MDLYDVSTVKEALDYLAVHLDKDHGAGERLALMVMEDLFNVADQTSQKELSREDCLVLMETTQLINEGMPLQYATGIAHFYGLRFKVDGHVLIPRPETEELVFEVISSLKKEERQHLKVLDIGTGSGCIALTLKKNFPTLNVYAMDKSVDALRVAEKNSRNLEASVHLIQDDITNVKDQTIKNCVFHYIISNPPYIQETERHLMDEHVLRYEPEQALFPKNQDPLQMYGSIIKYSVEHLLDGGYLFLELNEFLAREVAKLVHDAGFADVSVIKDVRGKQRILKAIKA